MAPKASRSKHGMRPSAERRQAGADRKQRAHHKVKSMVRPSLDAVITLADIVTIVLLPLPKGVQDLIGRFLAKARYSNIAAGESHQVVIRDDGEAVFVWHQGTLQIPVQWPVPRLPPGMRYVSALAGAINTVLIRSDGHAIWQGAPSTSPAHFSSVPPDGTKYTDVVETGLRQGILLRDDGHVDFYGQVCELPGLPAGVKYLRAAASHCSSVTPVISHFMLLRSDGHVVYGDRTGIQVSTASQNENGSIVDVACGLDFVVFLRSDGYAVARGPGAPFHTVRPIYKRVTYEAVAAGWQHVVLLRSDGKVDTFCTFYHDLLHEYAREHCLQTPMLPRGMTYTRVSASAFSTVLLRSDGQAVYVGDMKCTIPPLPSGLKLTRRLP